MLPARDCLFLFPYNLSLSLFPPPALLLPLTRLGEIDLFAGFYGIFFALINDLLSNPKTW